MTHPILKFVGSTHNSDGQETVNASQHRQAIDHQYTGERAHGRALRKMLEGWAEYADACKSQFDGLIGECDYVLAPRWAAIGENLRALLAGPVCGWDCGSLNHSIREYQEANGCEVAP